MQYNLSIIRVLNSKIGSHFEFPVKVADFPDLLADPNFKLNKDQTLEIKAWRIQDGVCVTIPSQEIKGMAKDSLSQEEFSTTIMSYATEKNFYLQIPDEEDELDVGRINSKTLEIQIDDLLNEAILLNLPFQFSKEQSHDRQANNQESPKVYSTQQDPKPHNALKDLLN